MSAVSSDSTSIPPGSVSSRGSGVLRFDDLKRMFGDYAVDKSSDSSGGRGGLKGSAKRGSGSGPRRAPSGRPGGRSGLVQSVKSHSSQRSTPKSQICIRKTSDGLSIYTNSAIVDDDVRRQIEEHASKSPMRTMGQAMNTLFSLQKKAESDWKGWQVRGVKDQEEWKDITADTTYHAVLVPGGKTCWDKPNSETHAEQLTVAPPSKIADNATRVEKDAGSSGIPDNWDDGMSEDE